MPLLPLAGVSMRSDDAPSPSLIGRSPERVAVPPAASVVVDGGDAIQVALLEFARVAEKCSISAAKTLAFDIVGKHLRPLGGAAHAAHKAALADAAAAAEAAKSPRILPTTPRTDATVWHKFSPADVARELTLWDHELFHAVPSTEFLRMSFTERERSPAFHAASDRFNAMARWAATEVLLRDTVALRAHQIERMMDVAEECRALSNFQGACAIVMGLTSTPIERLADEWERVPSKRRAKYDKLKAVFDMDRNFQAYRDALRGATPPIVPYLALISKYLFAIESHNDDFFEPQRPMRGSTFLLQITPTEAPKPQAADAANAAAAAAGAEELAHHIGADAPAPVRKLLSERRLVNCDKMLMLSQLIAEIESYQASQYAFASDTVLRVALTEAPIMTDEELFARSNLYRPGRSSRKATLARDTERNASGPDSDAASSVADDAASSVADDAEVSGGSATSARSEASGDAEDAGAAAAAADDDAANDDKSGGATPH
jgi:hypothetical protein